MIITYYEKNKKIAPDAQIILYFGNDYTFPVYQTNSDSNGNFTIEDLPSGYYIIHAEIGKKLKCNSHYIKVFPGRTVYQSIQL